MPPVSSFPHRQRIEPIAYEPPDGPREPRRRRARWAIAGGAAALALVALAFATESLVLVGVTVRPEPESLSLDSTAALRLGSRFVVRPGRYTVRAAKPGWHPLAEPIDVAESTEVAFALEKLPGRVRLRLEPADRVRVFVDGVLVAVTPLDDPLLVPPGPHALRFEARAHRPHEERIEVEGADVEQLVAATLTPASAEVSLDSEPPATFYVDGEARGETPGTFRLREGVRALELRRPGYRTWSSSILVEAGHAIALDDVVLHEADGTLRVTSVPSGARVAVGRQVPGATPVEIALASGVAHEVHVSAPGHELATREVTLEPASERTLRVELEPIRGSVDVVSSPAGAAIEIGERVVGVTPRTLELLAIPQSLTLRLAGYEPHSVAVTPRRGFPKRVDVELVPAKGTAPRISAQNDAAAPRRTTMRTSQGQILRRVPAGRFSMGTSRRERGRRANEALHPVEITTPFFIGDREVSNREFRAFRPGHRSGSTSGHDLSGPDQPVVNVSWEDAVEYCNWLSLAEGLSPAYVRRGGRWVLEADPRGYRLPTEAEWAWAARFAAGATRGKFPWGDDPEPPAGAGNFADRAATALVPTARADHDDGFPVSAPTGSFDANPIGLHDVGGNVSEWTNDDYALFPEGRTTARRDPRGPDRGHGHVVRGASWRHGEPGELRLARRDYGVGPRDDLGFRLARSAR